jgi:NADH-quinone oxidoreductase subunit L
MDASSPIYLLDKVILLPAIMAVSFLLILFIGKRLPEKLSSAIGIAAVSFCFVLSLLVCAQWIARVNHPPTGADMVAAETACGVGPGSGTAGHGGAEAPAEHAAPPARLLPAPVEGESAAAAAEPAGGEGHEAAAEGGGHESVVPVCRTVTWFHWGGQAFEAGTLTDGLTAMMLFTVTLISMLVHIYSTEYLHKDRRFTHYFAFLSLFTASMLFYVMGSNTLQMLVGWELVGLCSFALIGHWWEDKANSDAALKAFLTNRVGDTGLIIGIILLFFAAGSTFNVLRINEYALSPAANHTLLMLGALALFGGVTSKSGQFPLHTWLPDAMAGPTPVSALIHAATMVVAGVYLIARMYAVFWGGLTIGDSSLHYVAFIGGFTALIGASLAFVQYDIKKVLAYSTISQLGYMVMALGVGAWTAGVFHLFTHAMFKACLFLGAGSVSHAAHHTFDMRKMGGLKQYMPITRLTFLGSTFALAGIFPFAGFFSKDEILAGSAAGQQQAYYLMLAFGLVVAFMTACYMGRAYYMTFLGEYRGEGHPHESPKVITVPLIILGVLGLTVGFLNFPGHIGSITFPEAIAHRFEHYVQPTFAFPPVEVADFNPAIATLSLLLALGGLMIGMNWYLRNWGPHGLTAKVAPLRAGYHLLVNKYYLDALYEDVIVARIKGPIARAMNWVNQKVIDAVVNAAGVAARLVGVLVYRYIDQDLVDRVVNGSGQASEGTGQFLRRSQSGKVQEYASLLFGSAVVFVICLVLVIQLSA